MITVFVHFKLPDAIATEQMPMAIAGIASSFQNAFGLMDKSFLVVAKKRSFAAVLLWSSRENAEYFFSAPWKARMIEDYQFELYLTYFDQSFLLIDEFDSLDILDIED